jgi:hypothetical protein
MVLAAQFTKALGMLGFTPTGCDVALLLEFYGDPTTDRFVKWREIVDTTAMREVISNSDRELPFVSSVALCERRLVPLGLAGLCGKTYRSLMKSGFNLTDELLRLDGLKRGMAPQTRLQQLISLLSLRLSPAEITGILEFRSDEQSAPETAIGTSRETEQTEPNAAPNDRVPIEPILMRFMECTHSANYDMPHFTVRQQPSDRNLPAQQKILFLFRLSQISICWM